MTKFGKAITDIAYNVNDDNEDDDSNEDEDDEDDDGDAKLARKLSRQQEDAGERRSRRLAKDSGALQEAAEGTAERERKQIKSHSEREGENSTIRVTRNFKWWHYGKFTSFHPYLPFRPYHPFLPCRPYHRRPYLP